jgi:hypothetical protein
MKNYHLSKKGENWNLTQAGASRASQVFTGTKEKAVQGSAKKLQALPEAASLKIHKLNGRVQEERTYPGSADPKRSKG